MEELFKDCQRKMENSIGHLRRELSKLRTGSANAAILEGIRVDYYSTPTPLNQVATLGFPFSQTSTIQPYDISILKDLEKTTATLKKTQTLERKPQPLHLVKVLKNTKNLTKVTRFTKMALRG